MWLLVALLLALATPAGADPVGDASLATKRGHGRVDPRLTAWAEAGARAQRSAHSAPVAPWPWLVRRDGIVIHAASNGDPRALLAELRALGLRGAAVSGNLVSGVLPFDAVGALESCRHLATARPAMATTQRELARRSGGGPRPGP